MKYLIENTILCEKWTKQRSLKHVKSKNVTKTLMRINSILIIISNARKTNGLNLALPKSTDSDWVSLRHVAALLIH